MPDNSPQQDGHPQNHAIPNDGVYHTVRPNARPKQAQLYVPRFLSPAFFHFLWDFVNHPSANPYFLKEWRRNRRRLGVFENQWPALAAIIAGIIALIFIGLVLALRAATGIFIQEMIVAAAFLLPIVAGNFYSLISSIHGTLELSDKSRLEELRLTCLQPQEIVFGHLIGGIFPLSFIGLLFLPGLALLALDITVIEPINPAMGPVFGAALVLWFWPTAASSMLASAAISSAVSYAEPRFPVALAKALAAWSTIGFVVLYILLTLSASLVYSRNMGIALLVLFPLLLVFRLAVIGGFLQHMAVRLAIAQAEEEAETQPRNS